MAENGMRLTVP